MARRLVVLCGLAVCATLFGCGGVDVGGIPVDASGMVNNFDFGDINVGDLNGLGGAVSETLASAANPESEEDVADYGAESEEDVADYGAENDVGAEPNDRPHPADTDGDFAFSSEELLAYSLMFQSGDMPDGQGEAWLNVAIDIWQTRQDGAYYDDMESPEPDNWRPLGDEGTESAETETDSGDDTESAETETDAGGAGYDLLVEASSLSVAPIQLSVVDPNGYTNTDWDSGGEIGWVSGTAWDGVYTVKVRVQDNRNYVNERIAFSVRVYLNGELVHDDEHSAAEGATWDGLNITFQTP